MGAGWQFAILGPLEVRAGGSLVHVGGPRQRALLGLLLCHPNQVVSRDELIEELLAGQPPGTAERMLRVQISRLRQALADGGDGAPRVAARPPGYVLRVEDGELDLQVFEQRVAAGRAALQQGDPERAMVLLGEAESLWRGRPLADLEFESFARFEVQRLEADRLAAVEDRIEAQLAFGQHASVGAELGRLVAEHPLRERLRGQLMVALYRSGRQAEALECYRAGRSLLVAELGIEPGPGLRRVHEQVLVADPGLDAPAPPVAGIPASQPAPVVPRELPADVSAFTGRAVELAELDLLLAAAGQDGGAPDAVVISAVAGTAGVGKTTLAVRWAHRVAGQFPDGQLYVNLRGYDPGQPVTAGEALAGFLRALGVADADIPLEEAERAARYRSLVAGKRLLVVLDNAAAEDQVRPLLPGSGAAMVVVTSRDSLAGLVARDGARRLDLDLLPQGEAVALLCTLIGERADAEHTAVEALARQCARLPLALRVAAELAASWPGRPLADLVAELAGERNRLELLDAGGDPHGAVASVFSWSYRHLPADAAQMFRLLGLHPAQHWDLYAAAALTAAASFAQARRTLAGLARAHLIQPTSPGRYQMHDLLRAYAASLADGHDGGQARRAALTRLFDYYLVVSAAAMDRLAPAERHRRPGPPVISVPVPEFSDRADARAWLDAELATLTTVAAHTASHGWPSHTIRLAETLFRYLHNSHDTQAVVIHSHALDAARQLADRSAQARMLFNLANAHNRQGRDQQADDCNQQALALARDTGDRLAEAGALAGLSRYQQALELFRELGDQTGEARMLDELALAYLSQGRYGPATDHSQQALALAREVDDRHAMAAALSNLSQVCFRLDRYLQADDYAGESLALARETGYRLVEAEVLTVLGDVRHRQGHPERAAGYYQQALALSREIGDPSAQAEALNGLGAALLASGQPGQARDCHTTALTLARQFSLSAARRQRGAARALTGLGQVSHHQGHPGQAVGYYQEALALCREIGDRSGQAVALNGLGQTLLAIGQPGQARDCHTTALTLARRTGERYQQAQAHHGLAAAYQATGETSRAGRHRRRALDIYSDLGVPEASPRNTGLVAGERR